MADDDGTTPGIAGHLKTALVGAHDHLAEKIDARKKAHLTDVLETFEQDLAPLLAPAIDQLLANPGTPEHLRALLEQVGTPEHFSSSLLIGIALGAVLGPVLGSATQPFTEDIANNAWKNAPTRALSPDLLAAAVLKGVSTPGDAADEAALSGIDGTRFTTMVQTAGQSIGIAEALLLWRRGQIDDAHLNEIVQYSNVNPRFYDDVPKLRYAPPTAGEVITGVLKGHLEDGPARTMLAEAGLDPVNFDWLLATAGRPPSPLEAVTLWNRGEIDEARVDQVIRQSDINPDFAPEVKLLRWYYPPPRSIVPMLRSGAITEARARELLTQHGLRPEDVDAFVAEAQHQTVGSAKALTQAQITQLYEARLIDRPTAQLRLQGLKLPAEDVTLLLDLADEKRTIAMQNAAVRSVGSKYVAYRLTKTEAVNALGTLNVPTAAQHDLFTVWDVERDVNRHDPSPAAIVGAFRRGIIAADITHRRLNQIGVDDVDIPIVVADGWPPTKPKDALAAALEVLSA